MKYYQQITLLPTADVGIYFLWEKVYQQIHLALVEIKDGAGHVPVGISFPGYTKNPWALGNQLRLFSPDEETLHNLAASQWLQRLSNYVHITEIQPILPTQSYAIYQRRQPKSSMDRIARRKARRHNLSLEQAIASLNNFQEERKINNPYIQLKSQSSQHRFRLFIAKEETDKAHNGLFSTYGLSLSGSTVPIF